MFSFNEYEWKTFAMNLKNISEVIHPLSLFETPQPDGKLDATFSGILLYPHIIIGGQIFPLAETVHVQIFR